jgi:predicted adenylyl cyclase CyaB
MNMDLLNIEIKARYDNPEEARQILRQQHSDFRGVDHQVDTYFNVTHGRLKLREGNIERALIQYSRPDQPGPKQSDVTLVKLEPGSDLKTALSRALGVLVIVDKQREIHYLPNAKIHVDEVANLGSFLEIEVFRDNGISDTEQLEARCAELMDLFGVKDDDLVDVSYSDMLLDK